MFKASKDSTPTTTEVKTKKKLKETVAVWLKTDKNGNPFVSLKVKINGKEYSFVSFLNKARKKDTEPMFVTLEEV